MIRFLVGTLVFCILSVLIAIIGWQWLVIDGITQAWAGWNAVKVQGAEVAFGIFKFGFFILAYIGAFVFAVLTSQRLTEYVLYGGRRRSTMVIAAKGTEIPWNKNYEDGF